MRDHTTEDRPSGDLSVYLLIALCVLVIAASIYGGITVASELQGIAEVAP